MTKVLALDQSSTITGVAIGSTSDDLRGGYLFGTITAPKSPEFGEKLAHLFRELDKLLTDHKPDLVAYEAPFFPVDRSAFQGGKFVKSTQSSFMPEAKPAETGGAKFNIDVAKALQKVAGCVQTIAALHGVPIEEYAPMTWRKTLLGYGRMPKGIDPKKVVRDRVRSLGYDVSKFDEADALGVLIHALTGPQAAARAQGNLLSMAGRL